MKWKPQKVSGGFSWVLQNLLYFGINLRLLLAIEYYADLNRVNHTCRKEVKPLRM